MATGAATAGAGTAPGPVLKLKVAQDSITVQSFHGRVFLNPGIWLASLHSPLVFRVHRVSYTKPITITQLIPVSSHVTVNRPLPGSLLDGFNGLKNFMTMTMRNSAGKVVVNQKITFCPNTFDPEKVTPTGPTASPYPQECGFDPFPKGMVWGIQKGWAVNPLNVFGGLLLKLPAGRYRVTDTITPAYVRLFHIAHSDATASVKVKVVKATRCCGASAPRTRAHGGPLPPAPRVPTLRTPPMSARPDLVPLPSWNIVTTHQRSSGKDFLDFGATVWVGGNSRLDVQGFRSGGTPVMRAFQYFWRNGHLIGRARAGTMGFDTRTGHNHWHFEQFAAYRLLNNSKSLVVRSHKQGFCIAPSDPVDILLRNSTWKPSQVGFFGACGNPAALWVREMLPIGWGDTYFQFLAGQSFDITHVPNGSYFIEVIANPKKVLFETNTRNDISLRRVILGGTPGHRTVKVPAWHGIDPEGLHR